MSRAVIFLLALSAPAFAQAPAVELPAPTGNSLIGTTRWVVADASRDEIFAPGKKREIEIIAWYPAASASQRPAPYVRDGMEEVLSFARLAKLGDAFDDLASVKTHATIDAEPAKSPARFPVLVFQHGYTGLPSSHTALMEDLASHGWAVLNLIHPYEATGAMLGDGTVVTFTDEKNAMRGPLMEVIKEWGPEGGTMEKITAAADDADKEQLMRRYLGALPSTDQVVKRWTLDAKYALDHLPKSGFAGRIASRIAAAKPRSISTASRSTGR